MGSSGNVRSSGILVLGVLIDCLLNDRPTLTDEAGTQPRSDGGSVLVGGRSFLWEG